MRKKYHVIDNNTNESLTVILDENEKKEEDKKVEDEEATLTSEEVNSLKKLAGSVDKLLDLLKPTKDEDEDEKVEDEDEDEDEKVEDEDEDEDEKIIDTKKKKAKDSKSSANSLDDSITLDDADDTLKENEINNAWQKFFDKQKNYGGND